jgi:hypothetical protein
VQNPPVGMDPLTAMGACWHAVPMIALLCDVPDAHAAPRLPLEQPTYGERLHVLVEVHTSPVPALHALPVAQHGSPAPPQLPGPTIIQPSAPTAITAANATMFQIDFISSLLP